MVTSALRFALNEDNVYYYSISTFDADDVTGIEDAELRRASRELIAYFNSDDPALNIQVEAGGQQEQLFSPREVRHLQDVKSLVDLTFIAHEVALAYVMAYVVGVFIWTSEAPLRTLAQQALLACLITVAGIAAIGILVLAGFDSSWEGFHEFAFSNDLWQLDPDRDRLIQMFPEEFWFRVVMFVGGLIVLQAALIAGVALAYNGFARRREEQRIAEAESRAGSTLLQANR
jgi:integral membrane protein (TIGR01906 family)